MLRATRAVTLLAVMCGVIASATSASALGASPGGLLTSTEFRQLSHATAALNRSASSRTIDWAKARGACRMIGAASALLRTQRISCLDSIDALEALAQFPSEQARCAAGATRTATGTTTTGTTTTGTTTTSTTTTSATTTPGQSAVIRMIVCLNPHYQALRRYAQAIYSSDSAARKQAVARGFRGRCLVTLASTPADLGKEKRFSTSATRLAGDVNLLIKVTDKKLPSSDLNQIHIDTDVTRFERSARAVLGEHGPQKLSACPHR